MEEIFDKLPCVDKPIYNVLAMWKNYFYYSYVWASLVAQTVKNPPTIWETWIQALGWEDPLEEGMASHFSILAWRIPMDKGAWWATVHWVTESDRTEVTGQSISQFPHHYHTLTNISIFILLILQEYGIFVVFGSLPHSDMNFFEKM